MSAVGGVALADFTGGHIVKGREQIHIGIAVLLCQQLNGHIVVGGFGIVFPPMLTAHGGQRQKDNLCVGQIFLQTHQNGFVIAQHGVEIICTDQHNDHLRLQIVCGYLQPVFQIISGVTADAPVDGNILGVVGGKIVAVGQAVSQKCHFHLVICISVVFSSILGQLCLAVLPDSFLPSSLLPLPGKQ